ncbi:MAG TPA: FUSC family protein, partial [Verrucomicrobiae bacterium]
MKSRHLEALTFSLKAALSALIGVVGYDWAHLPGSPWVAAVSAVIVTQPTINSSLKASLLRVAANLGGAFCGLLLLLLLGHPLAAMTLGILI